MKRRLLSGTNPEITISSLGLGTVKFGRNAQVKYPEPFDLPSDKEVLNLLEVAQSHGINLLDTAPAYGISEERIGSLLTPAERENWAIVSKAGEEFINGESVFDFSKEAVTASVERTLSRLKTDRVEAVLLHSNGDDVEILNNTGAVEALFTLKEAGKLRAIGISTKTVEGGQLAQELGMDAVMATYNPWHTEEEAVLDSAVTAGKTVFLKKAFGSGWFGSEDSGEDPVYAAFDFIFKHPGATSVIAGTINPEHLKANCEAMLRVEADHSNAC